MVEQRFRNAWVGDSIPFLGIFLSSPTTAYSRRLILALPLVGMVISLSSPISGLASCVPTADQWFTATLSFDDTTLPEGVTITAHRNVKDGRYPIRDVYAVKNVHSTPFYLLEAATLSSLGNPIDPKTGLPVGVESLYKLVSEESYAYVHVLGTQRNEREWHRSHDAATGKAHEPKLDEYSLANMGVTIQSVARDNRPDDVQLPPSEHFILMAYYGERPIAIKGASTYQLNQDYDPHGEEKSLNEPCHDILP